MLETCQSNFEYVQQRIKSLPVPVVHVATHGEPELIQKFFMAIKDVTALKKLIDEGADVNTIFNLGSGETTLLCLAIMLGDRVILDTLLDAGASLALEIDDKGTKKSIEDGIKGDIETGRLGIVKGYERLAYALSKATL
jgi:hypothetical protein